MSFQDMTIAELRDVSREFAVDIENAKTKSAVLAAIESDGVTYEMYNTITLAQKANLEEQSKVKNVDPVKPSLESMLVRMDRRNSLYETHGVVFTREHPYALVDLETAQFIFDTEDGFRPATPRELQEFYS